MSARGKRRAFGLRHELVPVVLLAVVLAAAWRYEPHFVTAETQRTLSANVWELALLAVPMTLIVITGGIDLSVGATMGLSAVVVGLAFGRGMHPWAALGLALAVGTAAGALNGAFVAALRAPPLIVTLATMGAYRGLAEGIGLRQGVWGVPESFGGIARGAVLGVPVPGVLFAGAATCAALVLWRTASGRKLYAIGQDENAARNSGVGADGIKLLLYTLSGAVAALAAVLLVARRGTTGAAVGTGIELDVLAAVVLGGTSIFGGRGRIVGTVLGVLVIHEVRELVSWRWERDELTLIAVAALLVLSVLLHRLLSRDTGTDTLIRRQLGPEGVPARPSN